MIRVFNFAAGPGILPLPVLEEAAANFVDYHGQGMSLIEMSHRGAIFAQIIRETKDLSKETEALLNKAITTRVAEFLQNQ